MATINTILTITIAPNGFNELDSTKQSNYFGFTLPTLTVNNNGILTPTTVKRFRKYPYYVAIQDNNGSVIPLNFDPNTMLPNKMFGVHFFNKPLNINIREVIIGARRIPFFSYCTCDTNGSVIYNNDNKNGEFAKLPSLIMFNVLNGVGEPKCVMNGERINLYVDDDTFDTPISDNEDKYLNTKFERRAFTPVSYIKAYNIHTSSDLDNDVVYYKSDFTRLLPSEYTDGMELYYINSKYGKYRHSDTHIAQTNNKIIHYRDGEKLLWRNPIMEHGVEIMSVYSDKNDEFVEDLNYSDTKYLAEDRGEFQYVTTQNDETQITVSDEYNDYSVTLFTDVETNVNSMFVLCDMQDTIYFGLKKPEDETVQKTVHIFYYLDTQVTNDYNVTYGNKSQYDYSVLIDKVINPTEYSNYPYDWLVSDTDNGGWRFKKEYIPTIFSKRSNNNIDNYPGHIDTITTNEDIVKFKVPKTYTDSNNNEHYLIEEYEDISHRYLNNLRLFTVTDYLNKRVVSPIYDLRSVHVAHMNYIMNSTTFNGITSKASFESYKEAHADGYDSNYIYIWPQKPTVGALYANGSKNDIFEMPYLTNYSFTIRKTFNREKTIAVSNLDDIVNVLNLSPNEKFEYDIIATAEVDLPTHIANNDTTNKCEVVYIKYCDVITDGNTNVLRKCKARALKINKNLFNTNFVSTDYDSYLIEDVTGVIKNSIVSVKMGLSEIDYNEFKNS